MLNKANRGNLYFATSLSSRCSGTGQKTDWGKPRRKPTRIAFLPAAKPTGHRTVRVVVVVVVVGGGGGLLWGHDLKSKVNFFLSMSNFFGRGQLQFFPSILFSHPKFPSGWDPSRSTKICQPSCSPTQNFLRGGIQGSLTRFLFGVGSVT